MAEKFDEFLEEVENDIRHEKLMVLWKQYGKFIVGGLVGIVLLVTGYNLWGYYDHNRRAQMAEKLMAAQDYLGQGDLPKAVTILNQLSGENHKTYQQLALFEKAGILLKEGPVSNPKEAMAIYHQLATNKQVDPLWRDFAALLEVMVLMDQPGTNADDLLGRISPLTNDQNPWRYLANEMKGFLFHRKGDHTQATELFARLVQDNQTPSGISMRARLMIQIVSADVGE